MTWDETVERLEYLSRGFVALHKRPEKDWEIHEKDLARRMRAECVQLGEKRYSLVAASREKFRK